MWSRREGGGTLGGEAAEKEGQERGGGPEEEEDGVCGQPAHQLHQEGGLRPPLLRRGGQQLHQSFFVLFQMLQNLFRDEGSIESIRFRSVVKPSSYRLTASSPPVSFPPADVLTAPPLPLQVREDPSMSRKVAVIKYVCLRPPLLSCTRLVPTRSFALQA